MLEIIKSIIFGIVEGITEWLPISSTGHMILLDEFIKMNISEQFKEMYLVVIQLGAIMAVVLLFWWEIWPFCKGENFEKHYVKNKKISFLDNYLEKYCSYGAKWFIISKIYKDIK